MKDKKELQFPTKIAPRNALLHRLVLVFGESWAKDCTFGRSEDQFWLYRGNCGVVWDYSWPASGHDVFKFASFVPSHNPATHIIGNFNDPKTEIPALVEFRDGGLSKTTHYTHDICCDPASGMPAVQYFEGGNCTGGLFADNGRWGGSDVRNYQEKLRRTSASDLCNDIPSIFAISSWCSSSSNASRQNRLL